MQSAIDRAAGPVARRSTTKVEAEVEQVADAYQLTLFVQTATGSSRERLVASDCSLFVRLIALKVSLLATEPEPESERTTSSRQGAAAAVGGNGDYTALAHAWSLRAQAFVATTPVPSPAFGIALGAGNRVHALRLELLGGYLFPESARSNDNPTQAGPSKRGALLCARAQSLLGRSHSSPFDSLVVAVSKVACCAAAASVSARPRSWIKHFSSPARA